MKVSPQPKEKKRSLKWLRTAGNILLVLALIVFPLFLSSLVAAGWLINAESYGAPFGTYGVWMLILEGVMLAAVVLYFCKCDIAAVLTGIVSYLPMLWLTLQAVSIAEENGWSGQTAANFGRNAFAVWRDGLVGNAVPFVLLLVLAITRYLSYESVVRRQQRREAKEADRNKKSPSILGGETK